jgi:hypothetical protein
MKPIDVDITDYHQMVEMFHGESDRGAAVLAGSYVENYLGKFLISKMVDTSLTEKIFGANGSLSTFAQRIDFAQAFGFIGKEQCKELHFIRKIRNHFAHHPKSASFTDDPVRSWINSLHSSKEMQMEDGTKFKLDEPAGMFIANAHNVMLGK